MNANYVLIDHALRCLPDALINTPLSAVSVNPLETGQKSVLGINDINRENLQENPYLGTRKKNSLQEVCGFWTRRLSGFNTPVP